MAHAPMRLGAVAIALAMTAVACGDDSDQSTASTASPQTTASESSAETPTTTVATATATTETATTVASPATTAAEAPATTAASPADTPCDTSKDTIKIGVVYTLSGPIASVGEGFRTGTEAALDVANAAGGIMGSCLELSIQDDQNDPTKGSQAVRQLVDEEHVGVVLGPHSSTVAGATLPITTEGKILQFLGSGLPEAGDATINPYTFRVTNNAQANSDSFAKYVLDAGWKKVAVLAVNQALGTTNLDLLKTTLEAQGVEVSSDTFETGTVDLTPQLTSLTDGDPDGLVLFCTGADQVTSLSARSLLGLDLPTLTLSTAADPKTVEAVGADQMNDVFTPGVANAILRLPGESQPQSAAFAGFIDLMHGVLNEDPIQGSLQIPAIGYDSLMIYVTAANAVGSTDSDAIRGYLEANGYDGVYGDFRFTSTDHNGLAADQLGTAVAASFQDGSLELAN